MEPEILEKEMEKAKSKIWVRVTGGMPTKEFLLCVAGGVLLYYLSRLVNWCPAEISTC